MSPDKKRREVNDEAPPHEEEAGPAEQREEEAPEGGLEEPGPESAPASPASGEMEALRDRYLRLAAEFENYRKRTDRERLEARDRAQAQLVERLLEPLDDLQRVVQFVPEGAAVESVLEGVRMVEKKLLRLLEGSGLETVDPRGERFDPELHEALMTATAEEETEDDTVGEVFQKGYRFRGQMLRPARVQVRKYTG